MKLIRKLIRFSYDLELAALTKELDDLKRVRRREEEQKVTMRGLIENYKLNKRWHSPEAKKNLERKLSGRPRIVQFRQRRRKG